MQMALRQKIEELTQYALDEKNALTTQSEQIAMLENELARIAANYGRSVANRMIRPGKGPGLVCGGPAL